MRINLYPYQEEAINKLKSGSILLGGVGCGKSIMSIAWYWSKECGGSLKKISCGPKNIKDLYIITTAKKRESKEWDDDLSKFGFVKGYNEILKGTIIIDSWNNLHKYENAENSVFILDEQRIKGNGAWVRSFLHLSKNNHWILLSATPGDTFMDYIPVFIANGYFKNRTDFVRKHVVFDAYKKFPSVSHYVDEIHLHKMRKDITVNVNYDRRSKINTRIERTPFHGYASKEESWLKALENPYTDERISTPQEYIQVKRRLSYTCDERIKYLERILEEHPRIIVFYNYIVELKFLRRFCYEHKGIKLAECNGSRHDKIPDKEYGSFWIYAVQYAAGAEGWNCVETNTVVFFSPNYSYATMVQAAGRIDRVNSPYRILNYILFISNNGIDDSILQCLSKKKSFNEDDLAEKEFGNLFKK